MASQPDPWAEFPLANPAPAAPGRGGFIPGAARPPAPPAAQTPTNAQIDEENLRRLRLENAQREREAAAAARGAAQANLTVEERKASAFLRRALGSNRSYESLGIGPRSVVGQQVSVAAPDILNSLPSFIGNSPERQVADSNQDEFIAASLRQDSGAAIPEQELERQRRIYFPMPGDGPEAIAAKRQARRRAIEGLIASSGRALTPDLQEEIDAFIAAGDAQPGQPVAETDPNASGFGGIDPETGQFIVNVTGGRRVPDDQPPPSDDLGRRLHMGVGDVAEGVGDILGLVSNPFSAGVNSLLGTNVSTDLGATLRGFTGAPDPQTGNEQLASAINRGGVGGLTLAGAARGGAGYASGALGDALSRFAAAPLLDATAGAASGGSSDLARQAGFGTLGQILAGVGGGAASLPLASRIGSMASRPANVSTPLTRAGETEGVTVNRAMVDPRAQNRVTGVEATIAGGPIVRSSMNRVGEQIEGRVNALGRGGQALDENVAGQSIERSARRTIERTGQQARRLYDAAETAAAGVRVPPQRSLAVVDDVISRLSETSGVNSAEINFLNTLRGDLQRDLSVGALRRLRTQLRQRISNGALTFGEDEATVLGIMDAAADDIATGLQQAGRGNAVRLFRQADDNYRERMQHIQGTIQQLIGRRNANLPPERIFANFRAMATPRGNSQGMARLMRDMDPEDQADIAATFAAALGRNNQGEFSTAHFLSQAAKLPRSARVNLFGNSGAQSIDNLLELSRAHARVMGGLNNSRTGVANDWKSWIGSVMFGGGTGLLTQSGMTAVMTGVGTAGAKMGRDVLTARMLMSPNIQRWLRSAPATNNPRAISQHLDRLRAVAAREPALEPDIMQLQQRLLESLGQSPARIAAEEVEDRR